MKRLVRTALVVSLGFLATACDKCGNWSINAPQVCHGAKPQG